MEILAKLFGNVAKVRMMRLFLFNQDNAYPLSILVDRTKSSLKEVKEEINNLLKVGLIKKKQIVREVSIKKGKKINIKKVQDTGYHLDNKFPYLQALKNLLITVSLNADDNLLKKFAGIGKIKLFIASGVFIQEWDTRVDLLIVGDDIKMTKLEKVIKAIEAEIGKEITYSAFETMDFEYRYGMHDKIIRDIIDHSHVTPVDKLQIDSK